MGWHGLEVAVRAVSGLHGLAQIQAELGAVLGAEPELGEQRLDDYAMSWLTASGDLKLRTRDLYASLRDLLILPTLGPAAIAAITPRDVRDWHTDLGESTGPTARAQSYRLLRAI